MNSAIKSGIAAMAGLIVIWQLVVKPDRCAALYFAISLSGGGIIYREF